MSRTLAPKLPPAETETSPGPGRPGLTVVGVRPVSHEAAALYESWAPRVRGYVGFRVGTHTTQRMLLDGRVVIVGGDTSDLARDDAWFGPLASAEIWDPATGRFTATGSMARIRHLHTATLLPDGRVLIIGGAGARSATFVDTGIARTEIWDPTTGSFDDSTSLAAGRVNASTVLLPDGRVLVLGGSAKVVRGENVDDIAAAEFWRSAP